MLTIVVSLTLVAPPLAPSTDAWAEERPDTALPAPGAQYLGEVLFRDEVTGRLYLGRTLLGASSGSDPTRAAPLPAIGLDEAGSVIAPPSRLELRPPGPPRVLSAGERDLPPLAAFTTWYGFRLEPEYAPPGSVMVHEGDLATTMELPEREGGTSVTIFQGAAFRVERLSSEEALSFSPLRRDSRFFRRRSTELMEELLTVYRTAITATEDALSGAATQAKGDGVEGDTNVARLLRRSSPFWLILDEKERARGVRKMKEWLDGQIQRGGKCR